jgi:hypothetical protein
VGAYTAQHSTAPAAPQQRQKKGAKPCIRHPREAENPAPSQAALGSRDGLRRGPAGSLLAAVMWGTVNGGGHFWASALLRGGVRLRSAFICLGRQPEAPAALACTAWAPPQRQRQRQMRCARRPAGEPPPPPPLPVLLALLLLLLLLLLPCVLPCCCCCCRAAAAVHRNAALRAPRGLRTPTPPCDELQPARHQHSRVGNSIFRPAGALFWPRFAACPSPWRLAGWQPAGPERATLASTNSNACGAGSREWYGTVHRSLGDLGWRWHGRGYESYGRPNSLQKMSREKKK